MTRKSKILLSVILLAGTVSLGYIHSNSAFEKQLKLDRVSLEAKLKNLLGGNPALYSIRMSAPNVNLISLRGDTLGIDWFNRGIDICYLRKVGDDYYAGSGYPERIRIKNGIFNLSERNNRYSYQDKTIDTWLAETMQMIYKYESKDNPEVSAYLNNAKYDEVQNVLSMLFSDKNYFKTEKNIVRDNIPNFSLIYAFGTQDEVSVDFSVTNYRLNFVQNSYVIGEDKKAILIRLFTYYLCAYVLIVILLWILPIFKFRKSNTSISWKDDNSSVVYIFYSRKNKGLLSVLEDGSHVNGSYEFLNGKSMLLLEYDNRSTVYKVTKTEDRMILNSLNGDESIILKSQN